MGFNALNGLLSFLRTNCLRLNPKNKKVFQRPERASFISTLLVMKRPMTQSRCFNALNGLLSFLRFVMFIVAIVAWLVSTP